MAKQMNFDELFKSEFLQSELERPWFLQNSSARLVKFKGDSAELGRLEKGTLGVIVGSLSGDFDTAFHSGRAHRNVKYIDLEPMKVTEFTKEEKEMVWPTTFEVVEIVSNTSMRTIDKGVLVTLHPDKCCLKDKLANGGYSKEVRWHDLRVNHFKGHEPKRMLVWKDEI